jgi:hypothetical protein
MEIEITERVKIYKFLTLLLSVTFIISPFSIFILTKSILVLVVTLLVCFLISILIFNHGLKKWKSKVLLFFLILIGLIINAEIIFRVLFPELIIENLYERQDNFYFNKPNLSKVIDDDEFQTLYITNEFGYRVPNRNYIIKEPDWLFVGDSYTQGAQVNFNELYSSIIADSNRNKNVLNIGVSGFSLFEEYEIIKKHVSNSKPETVFLQLCVLNDFNIIEQKQFGINEWLVEVSDLYRFLYYNNENEETYKLNGRWVLPFYKNDSENKDFNVLDSRKSDLKKRILDDVSFYLKKIHSLLKSKNIQLVVILIPTKEQVYSKYLKEVVKNYQLDTNNIDLDFPGKFLNDLSENKFEFINPLDDFRKAKGNLYFDTDEHLNVQGHKVLADIINNYENNKWKKQ